MLDNFTSLKQESSADKIIIQIRNLITSGQIKPGDKLPSERKLAEKLGVGRTHVRDAIRKLEFYGILRTLPQSGTVVSGIGMIALEGLITDVLRLEKSDFASLVETRIILETNTAKLAALNRTDDDIENLKIAISSYETKIKNRQSAIEEDLMFHLKIAEASKNSVLKSLMLIITPDIVKNFTKYNVCDQASEFKALKEHQNILDQIINKNEEAASIAMRIHLNDVLEFSKTSYSRSRY